MIPVFRPSFDERELAAVKRVFESGWIGLGPETEKFEREFAEKVQAPYAVGLNSGTAALHLACLALGIGPGDRVLVPTLTFASTAHAVRYVGAIPVFVDVDRVTLNIDLADLRRKLRVAKAVIVVHYGGYPAQMDAIWAETLSRGIPVIQDAAHACGSSYRGTPIGGLHGAPTCFSFHAVKNLATGDGGMLTTRSAYVDDKVRRLRWCGISRSTWSRLKNQRYGWDYSIPELGYKCHMNDISAAIGRVQLQKLDDANARRREIAALYNVLLADTDHIMRPIDNLWSTSAAHNYVIQSPFRDELHVHLKERKVSTGVHYKPLHLQPYYFDPGVRLPNAEAVWTKLLSLPIYPDLLDSEVELICDLIRLWRPK